MLGDVKVMGAALVLLAVFAYALGFYFGAAEQRDADCAHVMSVPESELRFAGTMCLDRWGRSRVRLQHCVEPVLPDWTSDK